MWPELGVLTLCPGNSTQSTWPTTVPLQSSVQEMNWNSSCKLKTCWWIQLNIPNWNVHIRFHVVFVHPFSPQIWNTQLFPSDMLTAATTDHDSEESRPASTYSLPVELRLHQLGWPSTSWAHRSPAELTQSLHFTSWATFASRLRVPAS